MSLRVPESRRSYLPAIVRNQKLVVDDADEGLEPNYSRHVVVIGIIDIVRSGWTVRIVGTGTADNRRTLKSGLATRLRLHKSK